MGKGKRKREMELVQDKQERMVTFSKRRQGLFKKAQELSKLSGCEIAIITFSGAGKAFTFGSSDFDDIISRYLSITSASTSTSRVKGLQVESQPPNHLEHHVMEVSNQEFEQEKLFISQTHQMVSSSSSITVSELLPPVPEHASEDDTTRVCDRPWNGCDQFYPQFDERGGEWNGCGFDIGPDSAPTFFHSVQEDEQYPSGSGFFQSAEEGYGCGLPSSFHSLTPNQVDEGAILPFFDDEGYGFGSSFFF